MRALVSAQVHMFIDMTLIRALCYQYDYYYLNGHQKKLEKKLRKEEKVKKKNRNHNEKNHNKKRKLWRNMKVHSCEQFH